MNRFTGTDGWSLLHVIHNDAGPTEVMAAISDDGIGVLALWRLRPGDVWLVYAMDTEGQSWEQVIAGEDPDEFVPSEPPVAEVEHPCES